MKALSRSYVWWPQLDKEIETLAKSCDACLTVKQSPPTAPLHPWTWPAKPWIRIHVDFACPFLGKMFFVVVDAHSKWPEVFEMKSTTAQYTIEILRSLFSSYGLPLQLVSDNGPQFIAAEFAGFLERNGVKHIRSAPYHPATNGQAERFVRTFKEAMKSVSASANSVHKKLLNFLLCYRSTPHSSTGRTPASLFLHRELRTRLSLLEPRPEENVLNAQGKEVGKKSKSTREFSVGQAVIARSYG